MEFSNFTIRGIVTRGHALLFQDWFIFLAKDHLKITGQESSGNSWTLNTEHNHSIKVIFSFEEKALEISAPSEVLEFVKQISNESIKKIENDVQTPGGWWKIEFSNQKDSIGQNSLLHMLRNLGAYRRGPDKLRLGRFALLEIKDNSGDLPLLPNLSINASIITPGTMSGPFSKQQAERMIPVIGAVLSSCFGTPLTPGPSFFSVKEDKLDELVKCISLNEVQELGFQGFPIWTVLQNCHLFGAGEFANRLVGAMMAYEAGMLQRTDHSTLLFFVSAIESLTVPNLEAAKTKRLSKRFAHFLEEFCAQEMDEIMSHKNFQEAFGSITSRKKFANELYNLRSKPVHTGCFGNYSIMMMANSQSLKVGLVNDLVVAAILALIKQPVSLLWGHPALDPSVEIRLDPQDHQKLQKKAKNHRRNIEDYLKYLVIKDISHK